MPELAELKLTANFINRAAGGRIFNEVHKNPEHKGALIQVPFDKFNIQAISRGKELLMFLYDYSSNQVMTIRWTMGMAGHFRLSRKGDENKHSHLVFGATDNTSLCFVDVRRFGKWKLADSWSTNRGPDPTTEFEDFKANVLQNLHRPEFDKPISEVLMNQRYFNGIGNYLRAEILYRFDRSPFMSAREAIETAGDELFMLCRAVPELAYKMGGGEIKDWQNPFGTQDYPGRTAGFFLCYGNETMSQLVDKTGRRFWYHPKWRQINHQKQQEA